MKKERREDETWVKGHFADDDPQGEDEEDEEEEERIQQGRKTKRRGKKTNGETRWNKRGARERTNFRKEITSLRRIQTEEKQEGGEKKRQESSISQTAGSQVLFVSWQTGQKHRDTNILSVMQQTFDG